MEENMENITILPESSLKTHQHLSTSISTYHDNLYTKKGVL